MRHAAKVDLWLGIAIVAGIAIPLASRAYWASGFILALLLICAYPQWYTTTPEGLLIRAGLTRRLVPYEAITFIGPSSDGRSSVALSMDRVKIEWGLGSDVLIAPADPEAFFADMAMRTPHLTKRGQDLVASALA